MLPNKKITKIRNFKQKRKLPYNTTKKYINPFFARKKRKKIKKAAANLTIKYKLIIIGLLIILGCAVWYLFYSPFFVIKIIEVNGQGGVNSDNIKNIAWQQINNKFFILWPQKNIFLFDKNKLTDELNKKYSFEMLIITKKLPDKLIIDYKEKEYAFIWLENDKYYYSDIKGGIITETNPLEIKQKDYPLIKNQSSSRIVNNKITSNLSYINYVITLFNKFKKYKDDLEIQKYIIDNDLYTVKIILFNGPMIYFNINEDVDKQINKLIVIKNEKLKEDFAKKTCIDLRYGDRVYYR